jgi:hypothetical protein
MESITAKIYKKQFASHAKMRRASLKIFPDLMVDLADADEHGAFRQKRRTILAGGEILLDPVRENVLYPGNGSV